MKLKIYDWMCIPLDPPPSNLHMWSNASCSRLSFSDFEIPSYGVMSPTIADQMIYTL